MTTFANQTRSSTSWTNSSEDATSFTNQSKTVDEVHLLQENSFLIFLEDGVSYLLFEPDLAPNWTNQSES